MGVNYVSINIGMDMNPVSQVMSVLAGFRATIVALYRDLGERQIGIEPAGDLQPGQSALAL